MRLGVGDARTYGRRCVLALIQARLRALEKLYDFYLEGRKGRKRAFYFFVFRFLSSPLLAGRFPRVRSINNNVSRTTLGPL